MKRFLSNPWVCLAAIVALRLISLGQLHLMDTTDARYASIAQSMILLGNRIDPRVFQDGQWMSYWSKPPLAFWAQSGSLHLFGFSEWAARFPSVLWSLLMAALTGLYAERFISRTAGVLTMVLVMSMGQVFVICGATMTDPPLAAALTGVMVSFALFVNGPEKQRVWWGRAACVCAGLGMLAKGPIAIVFPGISVVGWMLFSGQWRVLLRFPWVSGLLLMCLVAAPWYYLMEQQEPGFLHYFLIAENFQRFGSTKLVLRHGTAHRSFIGFVWPILLASVLPWTFPLLVALKQRWRKWRSVFSDSDLSFLLWWGLGPILFLTFGRQVLAYYILPCLPAFALLTVRVLLDPNFVLPRRLRYFTNPYAVALSIAALLAVVTIAAAPFISPVRSTRIALERTASILKDRGPVTVAFVYRIPDSAHFYQSAGYSGDLRLVQVDAKKMLDTDVRYFIVRDKDADEIPEHNWSSKTDLGKWHLLER